MTSPRRIRANRANARLSSGPKSSVGKSRWARNAFRHGFIVPVALVPDLAGDLEALARRLCGEDRDPRLMELARRVAEAQIDLRRVRAYRQSLIQRALTDQGFQTKATKRAQFNLAAAILRDPFNHLPEDVEQAMHPPPVKGPEKLALIVADYARRLAALARGRDCREPRMTGRVPRKRGSGPPRGARRRRLAAPRPTPAPSAAK